MSPNNIYRSNAQDCLRMAQAAPDERDRPFWLTLAQSWLRLAEHAAREGGELEKHGPPVSSGNIGGRQIASALTLGVRLSRCRGCKLPGRRMGICASVHLGAGRSHHLGPFWNLGLHVSAQLLGRAAHYVDAEIG